MFDADILSEPEIHIGYRSKILKRRGFFRICKRIADLLGSGVLLLPLGVMLTPAILILNAFFNKGPLLYRQERMGLDCKPFTAYKFRTMVVAEKISRAADDPLETDRITPFGAFLRKTRIDELPQALNILKGEMSLIGPRPDFIDHAQKYLECVPGYRTRHAVRPGISGLAQVELGYIEGINGTEQKVALDLEYIERSGFRMDAKIALQTLKVILGRKGA